MTDNNHQILQDVRKGKIQPTTADWYTLTGMFERTRMRHIINSMPNEATARAVAEAISTQWHQLVEDMGYTEMWEVELVALQNGSEAWHCALTPPLSEHNNIVYEHIEDVLHTYITEFFTTNNRQREEPSAAQTTATTDTPPAEQQALLFATDDEEAAKVNELIAALDKAKITEKVLNTSKKAPLNKAIMEKFLEWRKNKELTSFNAEAAFRFVQKAGLEYNGKNPRTWASFIRKWYNEI